MKRGYIGVVQRIGLWCVAMLVLWSYSYCQEQQPQERAFSVGAYGGYSWNFLNGNFAIDPLTGGFTSSATCGSFETGSGSGIVLGGTFQFPLIDNLFLSFSPEYLDRSGDLRYECVDPANTRLPNGQVVTALTDHVAQVSHSSLLGRFMLGVQPFRLPLLFSIGPYAGLNIKSSYTVHEEIVTPASAEFLFGGQTRVYGTDDFEAESLSFGLTGSIRYELPAGERLSIIPELSYLLALSDDVPEAGLSINSLRATLGVLYHFSKEPQPHIVETIPEPSEETPALLAVTLDLSSRTPDGERLEDLPVYTGRIITTRLYPLLTYIFFDSGSAVLPDRYIQSTAQQTSRFREEGLDSINNALGYYYHVLDIIGSRMQRYPQSTIVLTGTQPDAPDDPSMALAQARAEKLREYLHNVWGISSERIAIRTRKQPEMRTNPETADGRAENIRVEISSNQYDVTAPLLMTDTLYSVQSSPLLITPTVSSTEGVEKWKRTVQVNTEILEATEGIGEPHQGNPLTFVRNEWDNIPESLDVELTVTDSAGQAATAESSIPVRHIDRGDSIIYGSGYYSLILFDFNRSTLRDEHRRTIDIVNQRTSSTTRINVSGYTDRLGEEETNAALSSERAKAVASELTATVTETVGKGEREPLYDNTLPEGRFYSRCVTIETQ